MLIFKILKKGIKVFLLAVFCLKFHTVFGATTYTLLEQLSSKMGPSPTLGVYLTEMFKLGIGVASVLAVIFIIIGGIKYMTAEAVGVKTAAKDTIRDAIFGLILALASWLLLNTINTDLINFNPNLTPVTITTPSNIDLYTGVCKYIVYTTHTSENAETSVSGGNYQECQNACANICGQTTYEGITFGNCAVTCAQQ